MLQVLFSSSFTILYLYENPETKIKTVETKGRKASGNNNKNTEQSELLHVYSLNNVQVNIRV